MLERRALLVAISGIFKAPPERRGGGAEAVANLLWHRAPNTHHERLDGLAGPHREGHGTGQRLVCDLHEDGHAAAALRRGRGAAEDRHGLSIVQTNDQVKGGQVLNVIVAHGAVALKLPACEDKALLRRGDAGLHLDLCFDVVRRRRLGDVQRDGPAGERLAEELQGLGRGRRRGCGRFRICRGVRRQPCLDLLAQRVVRHDGASQPRVARTCEWGRVVPEATGPMHQGLTLIGMSVCARHRILHELLGDGAEKVHGRIWRCTCVVIGPFRCTHGCERSCRRIAGGPGAVEELLAIRGDNASASVNRRRLAIPPKFEAERVRVLKLSAKRPLPAACRHIASDLRELEPVRARLQSRPRGAHLEFFC
mmetsp:Transcript_82688/g.267712  ORF Transcript_82688/g.267712 Transcript_82688/m.267712 type:complete len:366 (-) Transcript_82688:2664-3761(-)